MAGSKKSKTKKGSRGSSKETVSLPSTKEKQSTKKTNGSGRKKSTSTSTSKSKARSKAGTSRNNGKNSVKKSTKPQKSQEAMEKEGKLHSEIIAIVLLAIGVFLVLTVQTSFVGPVGSVIGGFLKGFFGIGGVILPYFIIAYAILRFIKLAAPFGGGTLIWMIILFLCVDLIFTAKYAEHMEYGILGMKNVYLEGGKLQGGGIFGMYVGSALYGLIGKVGLYIFSIVLALVSLLLIVNTPISDFLSKGKERRGLRKERKNEARLAKEEEERIKAEKEKELEDKRKSVETAGRQVSMDYVTPSKRAETLTDIKVYSDAEEKAKEEPKVKKRFFTKKNPREPKLNMAETVGMSPNQKKIMDMMQNEDPFSTGENRDKRGISKVTSSLDLSSEGTSLGVINTGTNAETNTGTSAGLAGAGVTAGTLGRSIDIGGKSVATKTSETETGKSEVAVTPRKPRSYKMPPLTLLNPKTGLAGKPSDSKAVLREKAGLLEETLASFNVDAHVTNVISGPSVTRYEIEPARGVKVSSITKLADDLALNMRAKSIRIEAPIPGKAAVGIEIENENRQMVTMKEILDSNEFKNNQSRLAFSVGRDIGGRPVVADLAKMPHMLIAGATGSGKSVCINSIIMSILYKARPEEVKLVLVDPKMVELGHYNGIPHLLVPVVTDPTKAAGALQWAVAEMTDRYKKFAKTDVRNIGAYNQKMKLEGETDEILPQIVIIIDELADLMMVASSQVEDAICRLAQLARAAGMHLILATQRPSVDVITGLIKANIPSRIAFMVSSQIDSRTIIDMAGAEKLVGNGDMLFKPQDLNKPKRIQGPFVSDSEVKKVIDFVKSQATEPEYNEEVVEKIENSTGPGGVDNSEDELMMDALEIVIDAGQASVSMLQRRFRIGYNRAARIVDSMEAQGLISPPDGARPRQVLVSREEFEKMREQG